VVGVENNVRGRTREEVGGGGGGRGGRGEGGVGGEGGMKTAVGSKCG